jgi:5-phospho-D-xylono-1,4-lactonase
MSIVPRVRTVLGEIDSATLGRTYCHEHLLTRPGPRFTADGPDMVLDDEDRSAVELATLKEAGGHALVEASTPEFGRDASGLRRLSERTGVHVVCCTGHVSEEYWRGVLDIDRRSESELGEEFTSEIVDGIGGSGVRAGVIKVGTSLDAMTEAEARVLRAAARAQAATGAPITTHTTAGTAAMDQIRVLDQAGADPAQVCVGHLDRRLVWRDHLDVARAGAYLGYDCISKEKYEPDRRRVEFIRRLFEAGFGDHILLSSDMARRSYLRAWGGGPGYAYILSSFVPALVRDGLPAPAVEGLLVANPARFLSFESVPAP